MNEATKVGLSTLGMSVLGLVASAYAVSHQDPDCTIGSVLAVSVIGLVSLAGIFSSVAVLIKQDKGNGEL